MQLCFLIFWARIWSSKQMKCVAFGIAKGPKLCSMQRFSFTTKLELSDFAGRCKQRANEDEDVLG